MNSLSHDKKVVDLEISLRRLGGDKKLLAKLAEFFLEDAPGLMTQLVAAQHTGDHDMVAHRAHSLKGLSATFEAIAFVDLAAETESLARSRDEIVLKSKILELEIEFERLVLQLQRIEREVALIP